MSNDESDNSSLGDIIGYAAPALVLLVMCAMIGLTEDPDTQPSSEGKVYIISVTITK